MSYHPYPAHRHKANGVFIVVNNADEDAQAHDEGYRSHPSLVGKPVAPAKAPEAPKAPASPAKAPTAAEKKAADKAAKKAAEETAKEPAPTAFDRTAAIATLEAANYEIPADTTDAELVEALAELAKG